MKTAAGIFLILGFCAAAHGEDWLRAGDEAYAKCDVAKTVAAYRAAKKADAKSYEATWKLARSVNDQGLVIEKSDAQKKLFLEAQALATEATQLNPKDSKGYVVLAIAEGKLALFEGGKKKVELGKDVKVQAEKALALNPKEDLAYHVLGIWHREMTTLNGFLKFFAQMIYGKFPPASLEASIENLKKAIELDGTAIAHRVELGLTYLEKKNWSGARDEFETTLKLQKQYPADPVYQRQAREKLEEAKKHLK